MESEVNIHYNELITDKSCDRLLANQIQRLLMCFDVYLESESGARSHESPVEFPKDKVFPRSTR